MLHPGQGQEMLYVDTVTGEAVAVYKSLDNLIPGYEE